MRGNLRTVIAPGIHRFPSRELSNAAAECPPTRARVLHYALASAVYIHIRDSDELLSYAGARRNKERDRQVERLLVAALSARTEGCLSPSMARHPA
jgi:hypothetical protein